MNYKRMNEIQTIRSEYYETVVRFLIV